jgi:serine/threonine protein kinase
MPGYCPSCLNSFDGAPLRCPNLGCGRDRPLHGWGRILAPGELIDRHYRVDRVLALGGAGLTYLARSIDAQDRSVGPSLAIKVLFEERASGAFLRRLANEAQLLQDLDHDHIVRSRGFVQRAGSAPYLVTVYEAGGTLEGHVQQRGPLPTPVACGVLQQVLEALRIAHSAGVVHRDLKPANVLLSQPTPLGVTPWVRVADFGIAKASSPIGAGLTQAGAFVGTPEYAAPEQLEGLPPSPATDLFAAAGLLWFMLTAEPPLRPEQRNDPLAVHAQLLRQLPLQLPEASLEADTHARLQRALAGLSAANPQRRWSVPRTLEALGPLVQRAQRPAEPSAPPMAAPAAPAPTLGAWDATILEPPPAEAPASAAAPTAQDLTCLDPEPPRPEAPRPQLPAPMPEPPRSEPRALTLDDLFGAPAAPAPQPQPPRPMGLDDLFGSPSAAGATPVAPPPAPAPPAPAMGWSPARPEALPWPLPSSSAALLRLVGAVRPEDRHHPLAALEALPRPELARALRAWRPGGEVSEGCGVGLTIAALGGDDLAAIARGLTRAQAPPVRCCAAEALGAVASGGLVATLGRMVADPDPSVRAAAARAIGLACARTGDGSLGRSWLQRMAQERDEEAAQARDEAMRRLG